MVSTGECDAVVGSSLMSFGGKVPCVDNKSFLSGRTRNIMYLVSIFRNEDNLPTISPWVQWSCFLRTTAAVSRILFTVPHPYSQHQLVLNTHRKTPPVLPDPTILKARRLAFLGTNNCVPRSTCPLRLCCISICAGTRLSFLHNATCTNDPKPYWQPPTTLDNRGSGIW